MCLLDRITMLYAGSLFLRRGDLLSDCEKRIEIMGKEILYYAGRKRVLARRRYFKLLKSCSKECGLEDPIYLRRKQIKSFILYQYLVLSYSVISHLCDQLVNFLCTRDNLSLMFSSENEKEQSVTFRFQTQISVQQVLKEIKN